MTDEPIYAGKCCCKKTCKYTEAILFIWSQTMGTETPLGHGQLEMKIDNSHSDYFSLVIDPENNKTLDQCLSGEAFPFDISDGSGVVGEVDYDGEMLTVQINSEYCVAAETTTTKAPLINCSIRGSL